MIQRLINCLRTKSQPDHTPESSRQLALWTSKGRLGTLVFLEDDSCLLRYDHRWLTNRHAHPLSRNLPLRKEPHHGKPLACYLYNLLPEGDNIEKKEDSLYEQLLSLGGDCAGAVIFLPESTSPTENVLEQLNAQEEASLQTLLKKTLFFKNKKYARMALAGAQIKAPVRRKDDETLIPLKETPSSHVVKPPSSSFPHIVYNEHYCMSLARAVGLPCAKTQVSHSHGEEQLYIERFDRQQTKHGWLRIHQEDFCQLLGHLPSEKYEEDGGPSLLSCAVAIRMHSSQVETDILHLLDWTIFNAFIGNADAHGKNIALLYTTNTPSLSPFYDLVSTRYYGFLSDRLAMSIGGRKNGKRITQKNWKKLACDLLLPEETVFERVESLGKKLIRNIPLVSEELRRQNCPSDITASLAQFITRNTKTLLHLSRQSKQTKTP